MAVKFNQDIAGSPNGYEIVEYKTGQVVDKLNPYLKEIWLEEGIIVELDDKGEEVKTEVKKQEAPANPPVGLTEEGKNELREDARKILDAGNLVEASYDALKEIGLKLEVAGMRQTKNPDLILAKIKTEISYVEPKDEVVSAERKAVIVQDVTGLISQTEYSDDDIAVIGELITELKVDVDATAEPREGVEALAKALEISIADVTAITPERKSAILEIVATLEAQETYENGEGITVNEILDELKLARIDGEVIGDSLARIKEALA